MTLKVYIMFESFIGHVWGLFVSWWCRSDFS